MQQIIIHRQLQILDIDKPAKQIKNNIFASMIHTFDIARSKYSLASSFTCFSNRTRPIKTKART